MSQLPKLIIIGLARHGKDTVAEILEKIYGLKFASSSWIALHEFIYDALKDKYGYTCKDQCFEDRENHREEWARLVREYNRDDAARLGRLIFANNDIYVGLRNRREFEAIKKEFNPITIWVDALIRKGITETEESNQLKITDADIVIYNNDTEEALERLVKLSTKHINFRPE